MAFFAIVYGYCEHFKQFNKIEMFSEPPEIFILFSLAKCIGQKQFFYISKQASYSWPY